MSFDPSEDLPERVQDEFEDAEDDPLSGSSSAENDSDTEEEPERDPNVPDDIARTGPGGGRPATSPDSEPELDTSDSESTSSDDASPSPSQPPEDVQETIDRRQDGNTGLAGGIDNDATGSSSDGSGSSTDNGSDTSSSDSDSSPVPEDIAITGPPSGRPSDSDDSSSSSDPGGSSSDQSEEDSSSSDSPTGSGSSSVPDDIAITEPPSGRPSDSDDSTSSSDSGGSSASPSQPPEDVQETIDRRRDGGNTGLAGGRDQPQSETGSVSEEPSSSDSGSAPNDPASSNPDATDEQIADELDQQGTSGGQAAAEQQGDDNSTELGAAIDGPNERVEQQAREFKSDVLDDLGIESRAGVRINTEETDEGTRLQAELTDRGQTELREQAVEDELGEVFAEGSPVAFDAETAAEQAVETGTNADGQPEVVIEDQAEEALETDRQLEAIRERIEEGPTELPERASERVREQVAERTPGEGTPAEEAVTGDVQDIEQVDGIEDAFEVRFERESGETAERTVAFDEDAAAQLRDRRRQTEEQLQDEAERSLEQLERNRDATEGIRDRFGLVNQRAVQESQRRAVEDQLAVEQSEAAGEVAAEAAEQQQQIEEPQTSSVGGVFGDIADASGDAADAVTDTVINPAAEVVGDVGDAGSASADLFTGYNPTVMLTDPEKAQAARNRATEKFEDDEKQEEVLADITRGPEQEDVSDVSTVEQRFEGATRGAGRALTDMTVGLPAELIETGNTAVEAGEFTIDAINEEGPVAGSATAGAAAVSTTLDTAGNVAEAAQKRPAETAGSLAAGAVVGTALTPVRLSKVNVPRTETTDTEIDISTQREVRGVASETPDVSVSRETTAGGETTVRGLRIETPPAVQKALGTGARGRTVAGARGVRPTAGAPEVDLDNVDSSRLSGDPTDERGEVRARSELEADVLEASGAEADIIRPPGPDRPSLDLDVDVAEVAKTPLRPIRRRRLAAGQAVAEAGGVRAAADQALRLDADDATVGTPRGIRLAADDRAQTQITVSREAEADADAETESQSAAAAAREELPPVEAFDSEAEFAAARDLRTARKELRREAPGEADDARELFDSGEEFNAALERRAARNRIEERLGVDNPREELGDAFDNELDRFRERIREQRGLSQSGDVEAETSVEEVFGRQTAASAGRGGRTQTTASAQRGRPGGEAAEGSAFSSPGNRAAEDGAFDARRGRATQDSGFSGRGNRAAEGSAFAGASSSFESVEESAFDSPRGQNATSSFDEPATDFGDVRVIGTSDDGQTSTADEVFGEADAGFDVPVPVADIDTGQDEAADQRSELETRSDQRTDLDTRTDLRTDLDTRTDQRTDLDTRTEVDIGLDLNLETETEIETGLSFEDNPPSQRPPRDLPDDEDEPFLNDDGVPDFRAESDTFDTGFADPDDFLGAGDAPDDSFAGDDVADEVFAPASDDDVLEGFGTGESGEDIL